MMKTPLLILLLALPAAARAQGLDILTGNGRPAGAGERSRLSVFGGYSDAEGLAHRSAAVEGSAVLGRGVGLDAGFSGHRVIKDGWLPGELYTGALTLNARNRRNFFSAGIRSRSDRPFFSAYETDLALGASRTLSVSGPHSFSAGLMYSSRRSFARHIPFPYVMYSYQSEKFSFRLPFSASWRPAAGYELSASYMPPKYCAAAAEIKASEKLKFRAEYAFGALQFELARRRDKEESVFIEQANAGLRTEYAASRDYKLALWTGWTLRGRYYRGKTYDEHHDTRRIGPAPAVSLGLTRFF